jgi:hypothetical protein
MCGCSCCYLRTGRAGGLDEPPGGNDVVTGTEGLRCNRRGKGTRQGLAGSGQILTAGSRAGRIASVSSRPAYKILPD